MVCVPTTKKTLIRTIDIRTKSASIAGLGNWTGFELKLFFEDFRVLLGVRTFGREVSEKRRK